MSWKAIISNQAREDLDYFRAHEPDSYKNSYRLTRLLEENPFEGPGRPIHATALGEDVWFRRLSLEHRMVYEVFDDLVVVASYRTHFE